MKRNQYGFGIVEILLLLAIFAFMAGGIWFVFANGIDDEPVDTPETSQESAEMEEARKLADAQALASRDEIRREHAIQMASRLLAISAIRQESLTLNQMGLDQLQRSGENFDIEDPLTQSKYLYEIDQMQMQAGEATFAENATCDNKLEGSEGIGLIERSQSDSIAVAIKLESAGFACESSL